MSDANKKSSSMITRQHNKPGIRIPLNANTKPPQSLSPDPKKLVKRENTPKKPTESPTKPPLHTSSKDTDAVNRYVCTVCKNIQSIRDFSLSTESNKLYSKVSELQSITDSVSDSAGHINSFDLSVRHLLLNKESFTAYQDNIQSIERNITELNTRLNTLTSTPTVPKPDSQVDTRLTALEKVCEKISTDLLSVVNRESPKPGTPDTVISDISDIRRAIENLRSVPSTPVGDRQPLFPEHDELQAPSPNPQQSQPALNQGSKRKLPSGVSVAPFKSLSESCIPPEVSTELLDHFTNRASEFTVEGSCRKTLYYGEHDYHYNGGKHTKCDIPANIKSVIELTKERFPLLNANSCLVTLYSDGNDYCPMHADNETCIDPESDIVTISLGATRTMSFQSQFHGVESKSVDLLSGSALCFSRKSQEYWRHSILSDCDVTTPRISLTLRHVAPYFTNSTILFGDSNTKNFRFGPASRENRTFGIWMPGKRVKASTLLDIPSATDIAPYSNVIIHAGVNDLRNPNPPSPLQMIQHLERKCAEIHNASPRTKILICPALPTKDSNLNHRVNMFNSFVYQLCEKDQRLHVVRYSSMLFADGSGLLKPEMGRWDREKNGYRDSDHVHLGSSGIREYAKVLKSHIVRPRNSSRNFVGDYSAAVTRNMHNESTPG